MALEDGVDGWIRHEKLIASVLERHDREIADLNEKLVKVRLDVASLMAKASLIGAIAGAAASVGATLLSRG